MCEGSNNNALIEVNELISAPSKDEAKKSSQESLKISEHEYNIACAKANAKCASEIRVCRNEIADLAVFFLIL